MQELGLVDDEHGEVKGRVTLNICFRSKEPGGELRPVVQSLEQMIRFIREHVLAPLVRDVFL